MTKTNGILIVISLLFGIFQCSCGIIHPSTHKMFAYRDSLITQTIQSLLLSSDKIIRDSIFLDSNLVLRNKNSKINCRMVPLSKSRGSYFEKTYRTHYGLKQKYKISGELYGINYFNKKETFNYCQGDTFMYIFFAPVVQNKNTKFYELWYSVFSCEKLRDPKDIQARWSITRAILFRKKGSHFERLVEEEINYRDVDLNYVQFPLIRGEGNNY